MRATMQVLNPNTIEFKVTLVAPLAEWRTLREQLPDKWPSFDLRSALTDAIIKAEAHFDGKAGDQ